MSTTRVRRAVIAEFYRESEQRWVGHANIRTWGPFKDEPKKWRHRIIETTTVISDWHDGRQPCSTD